MTFLLHIAGKKSSGRSRAFQMQKESCYGEARKNAKELVRDGIGFLYRNLHSFQKFFLKTNLGKMHKRN